MAHVRNDINSDDTLIPSEGIGSSAVLFSSSAVLFDSPVVLFGSTAVLFGSTPMAFGSPAAFYRDNTAQDL